MPVEKVQMVYSVKDEATAALDKIGKAIKNIVGSYIGLKAGKEAFVETFRAFADYEANLKSIEAVAKTTGRDVNEVYAAMGSQLGGVADKASIASGFLKGMTTELTVEQINNLTTAVRDASIAMGEDFAVQFPMIIKAIKQLNPAILDNIGVTVRLDQVNKQIREGYYGLNTQISEATQQNAIYQEVLRQTAKYQGQEEQLLQTSRGAVLLLAAAYTNLKIAIGSAFGDDAGNALRTLAIIVDTVSLSLERYIAMMSAVNSQVTVSDKVYLMFVGINAAVDNVTKNMVVQVTLWNALIESFIQGVGTNFSNLGNVFVAFYKVITDGSMSFNQLLVASTQFNAALEKLGIEGKKSLGNVALDAAQLGISMSQVAKTSSESFWKAYESALSKITTQIDTTFTKAEETQKTGAQAYAEAAQKKTEAEFERAEKEKESWVRSVSALSDLLARQVNMTAETKNKLLAEYIQGAKGHEEQVTKMSVQWSDFNENSKGRTREFVNSLINSFTEAQNNLATSFSYMGQTFSTNFIQRAYSELQNLINLMNSLNLVSLSSSTISSGGYGGYYGPPAPGTSPAPAIGGSGSMIINFNGNVTDRSFVNSTIVPAIESASRQGVTTISSGGQNITGDADVVF